MFGLLRSYDVLMEWNREMVGLLRCYDANGWEEGANRFGFCFGCVITRSLFEYKPWEMKSLENY